MPCRPAPSFYQNWQRLTFWTNVELAKRAARASQWMNATKHWYSNNSLEQSIQFDLKDFLYEVTIG